MKLWHWTLIIVAVIVVLVVVPLSIYGASSEFGGADGQAEEAIAEVAPEYEPWFAPLWEPPGGETEGLLFALQAAIGAGLIFFAFGYWVGRRKGEQREQTARGGGTGIDAAEDGFGAPSDEALDPAPMGASRSGTPA